MLVPLLRKRERACALSLFFVKIAALRHKTRMTDFSESGKINISGAL